MKTLKMTDLVKKDLKTLEADKLKLAEEILKLKIAGSAQTKRGDDVHVVNKTRKQIARLNTAIAEVSKKSSKDKDQK